MTSPRGLGQARRGGFPNLGGAPVFPTGFKDCILNKQSTKKAIPKRRGRPATGKAPSRTFRLSDEFMGKVDAWAAAQKDEPRRSEAIRRLVELGLRKGTK